MLTITKEQLINEREALLRRVAATEAMLFSYFNWKPGSKDSSILSLCIQSPYSRVAQDELPITSRSSDRQASQEETIADIEDAISYTAEAAEWVKGVSGKVMVRDFEKWLMAKYPPEKINRSSINAPFRKLAKDGVLTVVRQGVGKMPSIFEKTPEPLDDDDEV